MSKLKGLLATVLAMLFSSLLCIALYHFDNKYTQNDNQPINGVLFDSADTDLRYLTRQWMVYPDVLLTPADAAAYDGYRYYADIGGPLESDAHCFTYQLTLLLPQDVHEYALELPEVYSACKLYINDRLLLQLGDPSAASYTEALQSRLITFSASGETQILLLISDYSGVSRGLTYPPAFGTPEAVLAARETRLLLHGGFVLLALLGAGLALCFGLRGSRRRSLSAALLCCALAVVTGYPLYHGLFITGVQPWYTLEPFCYYSLLLLQSAVYELSIKRLLLLAAPCAVGLLLTLVRFGFAAWLPAGAAALFSWLAAGLKYYSALGLLGLSFWALCHNKSRSALLLSGSAALATCLIWDRLLPLYEPIYGGWLGEVGGILLVITLIAALWLDALDAYRFRLTYQSSLHQLDRRLAMQREHYAQLSNQVRLAREAGHDLRHHMRTMLSLAQHNNWDRLKTYLAEYEPHIQERELTIWSDHPTADAVLAYYAAKARRLDAAYDVRMTLPPDLSFPDDELCILLSNLLENALDALAHQTHGARRIYLRGEAAAGRLGIVLNNTCNGELQQKDGIFLSSKHAGPGLGLSSISTIAEKYGGLADFDINNGEFHALILIPLAER